MSSFPDNLGSELDKISYELMKLREVIEKLIVVIDNRNGK